MIIELLAQAIGGTIITMIILSLTYDRVIEPKITKAIKLNTASAEKLAVARKRLGQIANRESLSEVRRLANQALKETSK